MQHIIPRCSSAAGRSQSRRAARSKLHRKCASLTLRRSYTRDRTVSNYSLLLATVLLAVRTVAVLSACTSTSTKRLTDVFALMAKRLHRRRRIVKAGTPLRLAGTQSRRSKQIARLVCSSDKSVETRLHTAWQASLSRKSRSRGRWRSKSTSTLFGSDSRRRDCACDAEHCDGRIGLSRVSRASDGIVVGWTLDERRGAMMSFALW